MTQAKIATTSQEALEALLCDSMPPQGCWSDEQYLWLTDQTRRLVEFTDGHIEELPMPTNKHQILTLAGDIYVERGAFSHGDTATSRLLDGFAVDVTALFEYAEG